ncbi:hypothetical protein DZS_41270 [Dickeya ananatis]|uniref:hypothetical protein n=1 Tax=Dickeya ananatis TaxID=3061286 RepID=UPI00388D270F
MKEWKGSLKDEISPRRDTGDPSRTHAGIVVSVRTEPNPARPEQDTEFASVLLTTTWLFTTTCLLTLMKTVINVV